MAISNRYFCQALFIFILITPLTAAADSLYDRSLALLARKSAPVDPAAFSFVVLGDSRGNDAVFTRVLRKAAEKRPLFILHGGDLGDHGTRKELESFLAVIGREVPDMPVFVVRANHEQDTALFRELIAPLQFVIDLPRLKTLLVSVDNSSYELTPQSLVFLTSALALQRNYRFVAMHIPPKTAQWDWHTFSTGAAELLALLTGQKATMAFFSHVHQYARDDSQGIPFIISGGAGAKPYPKEKFPGEPVYHFVLVTVKNGKATAEMIKVE